jgi:hypothetical protein
MYQTFEQSAGDYKVVFAPFVKRVGENKEELFYLMEGYAIIGCFEDGVRYNA